MEYVSPKRWYLPISPRGVTAQKTEIDISTAVRMSHLEKFMFRVMDTYRLSESWVTLKLHHVAFLAAGVYGVSNDNSKESLTVRTKYLDRFSRDWSESTSQNLSGRAEGNYNNLRQASRFAG
jgi:hypothetical protein